MVILWNQLLTILTTVVTQEDTLFSSKFSSFSEGQQHRCSMCLETSDSLWIARLANNVNSLYVHSTDNIIRGTTMIELLHCQIKIPLIPVESVWQEKGNELSLLMQKTIDKITAQISQHLSCSRLVSNGTDNNMKMHIPAQLWQTPAVHWSPCQMWRAYEASLLWPSCRSYSVTSPV